MDFINTIFKGDKSIWVILMFLCLISVIEVFSASSTLTYGHLDHWAPITQHCTYLLGGFAIVLVAQNVPFKWFKVLGWLLMGISIPMLMWVLFFGGRVNGAARWIELGGIQFQPSEFGKVAVVILTASALARGQNEEGAAPNAFTKVMWIAAPICVLILPENYSTAMLLGATVYLMMLAGRVKLKKLLALAGSVIAAGALFMTFLLVMPNDTLRNIPAGHRFTVWKGRVMEFTANDKVPAAKYDIDGKAQEGHANIAIATSNIVGKGPGNSVERDFLSQAYSDFIFAIIIEELGLIGAFFVVLLYITLLVRAGKIARQCDKTFPAFLVMGIALLMVLQALFNMCVSVGLVPVTGQPLPLISRGGTSLIINCCCIGMMLSVSRYAAEVEKKRLLNAAGLALPQPVSNETGNAMISEAQTAPDPTFINDESDTDME